MHVHTHTYSASRTCHTNVTLLTKTSICLFLNENSINRGLLLGMPYPSSPKSHKWPGLSTCLSGYLQQHDCEHNIHSSGGWKTVRTGELRHGRLRFYWPWLCDALSSSALLNASFQIVSGGPIYLAEYIVIEATCIDDTCVALNDTLAVSAKSKHVLNLLTKAPIAENRTENVFFSARHVVFVLPKVWPLPTQWTAGCLPLW